MISIELIDFLIKPINFFVCIVILLCAILLVLSYLKEEDKIQLFNSQAIRMINKEQALWLDVRSHVDFKKSHIFMSKNFPLEQLEEKISSLNKNQPIIIISNTNENSKKAQKILKKLEFEKVFILRNGIQGWLHDSLPIIES